jgi:hypothetical protein
MVACSSRLTLNVIADSQTREHCVKARRRERAVVGSVDGFLLRWLKKYVAACSIERARACSRQT